MKVLVELLSWLLKGTYVAIAIVYACIITNTVKTTTLAVFTRKYQEKCKNMNAVDEANEDLLA